MDSVNEFLKVSFVFFMLALVAFVGVKIGTAILHMGLPEPADTETVQRPAAPPPAKNVTRRQPSTRTYSLPMLSTHKTASGKREGSCEFFPFTISITEDGTPLRINISENVPIGTGKMMRNSLWTAALIAALQKDSTLQGVRISIEFNGSIDGPSAGAVMCLGIMSALEGRDFPDDFAMTGTILPDGTIGLVGGVPEKLLAAAKNPRIRRVAVPAFERFVLDAEGNWVDIFETARNSGLQLYPVESITDAYIALHHVKTTKSYSVSAISDCREDHEFENEAASIFVERVSNLRARINGLSSNDLETVTSGWVWESCINPEIAEWRFKEGAILDALNLVSVANASLDALLESWWFYCEYESDFLKRNEAAKIGSGGDQKRSLRDIPAVEWPVDKKIDFVAGLDERIRAFCEKALGYRNDDTNQTHGADAKEDQPLAGFHPMGAKSDFEAQFQSVWERAKAYAQYHYTVSHTPGREELKEKFEYNGQDFFEEIRLSRGSLYFFLAEFYKRNCLESVPMPILNVGPNVGTAWSMFYKAWKVVDNTIDVEVMDLRAKGATVGKETIRGYYISEDIGYSNYEFSKQYVEDCLGAWSDANSNSQELEYPSWTQSYLLFNAAEMFAEASAQLFSISRKDNNASFVAFVMDRARESALQSIAACHRAGISCVGPILSFQKAERTRLLGGRKATAILADYWKATMVAKVLVMAFCDGVGPQQGFNGYPPPADTNAPLASTNAPAANHGATQGN